MNEQTEQQRPEDIVEAYAMSVDSPDLASLAEWVRRYPQFEKELTDFAAAWARMEHIPADAGRDEVDTETLLLRSMSIVRDVMHSRAPTIPAEAAQPATLIEAPLTSIVSEATRRGLTLLTLAERLDLSPSLVRKIDRRLIAYARIPLVIIDMLVVLLGHARLQIEQYLQGPQQFAAAARHKAVRAPTLAPKEDFFDAVRADPELRDDQRQRWLSLEQRAE